VTLDIVVAAAIPAPGMALPLLIPAGPVLCGRSVFLQAIMLDRGAAHAIANTPGLELVLGS
jgi:hypothetical protein